MLPLSLRPPEPHHLLRIPNLSHTNATFSPHLLRMDSNLALRSDVWPLPVSSLDRKAAGRVKERCPSKQRFASPARHQLPSRSPGYLFLPKAAAKWTRTRTNGRRKKGTQGESFPDATCVQEAERSRPGWGPPFAIVRLSPLPVAVACRRRLSWCALRCSNRKKLPCSHDRIRC